jgi:hypothetical protein
LKKRKRTPHHKELLYQKSTNSFSLLKREQKSFVFKSGGVFAAGK